jgi:hypothetical protein
MPPKNFICWLPILPCFAIIRPPSRLLTITKLGIDLKVSMSPIISYMRIFNPDGFLFFRLKYLKIWLISALNDFHRHLSGN